MELLDKVLSKENLNVGKIVELELNQENLEDYEIVGKMGNLEFQNHLIKINKNQQ